MRNGKGPADDQIWYRCFAIYQYCASLFISIRQLGFSLCDARRCSLFFVAVFHGPHWIDDCLCVCLWVYDGAKKKSEFSIAHTHKEPAFSNTHKGQKNRNKLMSRINIDCLILWLCSVHPFMNVSHTSRKCSMTREYQPILCSSWSTALLLLLLLFFGICTSLNYHSWIVLHTTWWCDWCVCVCAW